ncbi:MAG: type II toxin-antitoxin system VapB family antitoxin [Gemmatimonadetes bacterium]|nr:type II toxin-antitoxin system VapB family antitoxin [Gemmatimonadota bacterium]MBT8404873.1 type II toxin-antitoxin system VapB family antitoxin [Gemmatimonadota bacterium]NNF37800.1 type II toxin-antitoxin system VapB family antitoxin [Gemmatimonadota bacterium]NNK62238.1 type II toxin-antitoxin system VapB family antitoxin [Gemmatimonadota bacterium]
MPLNIKNVEVERLVDEVVAATGESKTEAVRVALLERRARLRMRIGEGARARRVQRFLEDEVWSSIPDDQLGRAPDKAEREAILGYGSEGV